MDLIVIYCVFKTLCLLAIAIPVTFDIKRDWSKSRVNEDDSLPENV